MTNFVTSQRQPGSSTGHSVDSAESSPFHVLHILEPLNIGCGSPTQVLACDLIRSQAGQKADGVRVSGRFNIDALILGPAEAEKRAAEFGLVTHDRILVRSHAPWWSLTAFQRYVRRIGQPDLVHCWSFCALILSHLACPSVPKVLTLAHPPFNRAQGEILALMSTSSDRNEAAANGSITVLATTNEVRRSWGQYGLASENIHVLRPGLTFDRINYQTREQWRSTWNVIDREQKVQIRPRTAPKTEALVVGVIGDPCESINAARAATILSLARLAGHDVYMVVPPAAAGRNKAYEIVHGARCDDRFIVSEELEHEPWSVLNALDVALVLEGSTFQTSDNVTNGYVGRGSAFARLGSLMRYALHSRGRSYVNRIYSSSMESTGSSTGLLPLMWACAAGKVIVADATYSISELLENQQSALVCPPGDDHAIVRRLAQLIDEPQLRCSIADQARSEAFSFYSQSRFNSDHDAVYRQIASRQPIVVPDLPPTGGMTRFTPPLSRSSGTRSDPSVSASKPLDLSPMDI